MDPTESSDNDNDGIGDNADTDDDNDGIPDAEDAFPNNPNETLDTDQDGIGNTTDLDDDNDGYSDALEAQFNSDPLDAESTPPDQDGDYIPDEIDPDADGDGFADVDVFISEVVTPGVNGPEATWQIVNLDLYPNSIVKIYNRNGQEVYSMINYQNDWSGIYEKTGQLLAPGSYYYRIQLNDQGQVLEGWLYLSY